MSFHRYCIHIILTSDVRKKIGCFMCHRIFGDCAGKQEHSDHYTQLIDLFRVLEINSAKWKR